MHSGKGGIFANYGMGATGMRLYCAHINLLWRWRHRSVALCDPPVNE